MTSSYHAAYCSYSRVVYSHCNIYHNFHVIITIYSHPNAQLHKKQKNSVSNPNPFPPKPQKPYKKPTLRQMIPRRASKHLHQISRDIPTRQNSQTPNSRKRNERAAVAVAEVEHSEEQEGDPDGDEEQRHECGAVGEPCARLASCASSEQRRVAEPACCVLV